MENINIELLPEEAKKELLDFYKNLLKKYKLKDFKKEKRDEVDIFFDRYNLDFSNFKFDREKLYER